MSYTPYPNKKGGGLEYAPAAASKILKSVTIVDPKNYTVDRLTLERVRDVIPLAEKALGGGENILEHFAKVRAHMATQAKERG